MAENLLNYMSEQTNKDFDIEMIKLGTKNLNFYDRNLNEINLQ